MSQVIDGGNFMDVKGKSNADVCPFGGKILSHAHRRYCDLVYPFLFEPASNSFRLMSFKMRAEKKLGLFRFLGHSLNVSFTALLI